MKQPRTTLASKGGFTLLEVLVSLIIGTVIVGGVMGLISVSLQYSQRVKARTEVQPILEAAAQEVLTHPARATEGTITVPAAKESHTVEVRAAEIEGPDGKPLGNRLSKLHRVVLSYRGHILELSLLIPQSLLK